MNEQNPIGTPPKAAGLHADQTTAPLEALIQPPAVAIMATMMFGSTVRPASGTESGIKPYALPDLLEHWNQQGTEAEVKYRAKIAREASAALETQAVFFVEVEQPHLLKQTNFVTEFTVVLLQRVIASNEFLASFDPDWYTGDQTTQEAKIIQQITKLVPSTPSPTLKDWYQTLRHQLRIIQYFLEDTLEEFLKRAATALDGLVPDDDKENQPFSEITTRANRPCAFYLDFAKVKDIAAELLPLIKKHYGENATAMDLLQDIFPVDLDPTPAPHRATGHAKV